MERRAKPRKRKDRVKGEFKRCADASDIYGDECEKYRDVTVVAKSTCRQQCDGGAELVEREV